MSMSRETGLPVVRALRHECNSRRAWIVEVADIAYAAPVIAAPYTLMVASDRSDVMMAPIRARAWIDAGAASIVIWSPATRLLEFDFDVACIDQRTPDADLHVLTATVDDEIEEALFHAFHCAGPVYGDWDLVVILVDSEALANRCEAWNRCPCE
jgi:hypothetical protein